MINITVPDSRGPAAQDRTSRKCLSLLAERYEWAFRLRPRRIGTFLLRIMAPSDRRRIIQTSMGVRLYVDPLTDLGRPIVLDGIYEPDTVELLSSEVSAGQVVMDVGANEGLFSAVAGKLVGPHGLVIAVEPQSRLRDLIEINLRINNISWGLIYQNALGGADGEEGSLFLYPAVDTGMSSVVKHYHSTTGRESFQYVSVERIMQETGVGRLDLVKVDVEGLEYKVVEALLPHVKEGRIGKLFLDYHSGTLSELGVSPQSIHEALIASGMRVKRGDENILDSYLLYENTRPEHA